MSDKFHLPIAIATMSEDEQVTNMLWIHMLARHLQIRTQLQLDPTGPRTAAGLMVETRMQYADGAENHNLEVPVRLLTLWGTVPLDYTHEHSDAVEAAARLHSYTDLQHVIEADALHGDMYAVSQFGSCMVPDSRLAEFEPVNPRAVMASWLTVQYEAADKGFSAMTPQH